MDRSQDWLRQALRDLEKVAADKQGGYFEWACFTAHQASEKALKAVFQRQGSLAAGHSLTHLLYSLPSTIALPDEVRASAMRLDQYYIPTRYPDGFPSGAPQDYYQESQAEEAHQDARAVVEFCQNLLAGS